MKAIETKYKGYRFRSRLEARWAVFLDTLSVEFQYETEGYQLGTKDIWYLPDFFIPAWNRFLEIKPATALTKSELEKVALLVQYSGKPMLIVQGDPWPGAYRLLLFIPTCEPGEIAPHRVAIDSAHYVFAAAPTSGRVYLYRMPQRLDSAAVVPASPQDFIPLGLDASVADGKPFVVITKDNSHDFLRDIEQGIHVIIGPMDSERQLMECDTPLSRAFVAARRARFEHGESG